MLVSYSSSSGEDSDSEPGGGATTRRRRAPESAGKDEREEVFPAKKKPKPEELLPKTKLPLPECVLEMFGGDDDPQNEDGTLHGGRIRSFKHERGNWATYVYLPYFPEEEFGELMAELLSAAGALGVVLTQQEEFHLSLSQTVVLKHHWIEPFTQSLRVGLLHCRRFLCSAATLRVYSNAERTRTFLGMEMSTGHAQLLDLVRVVDRTVTEFELETFYKAFVSDLLDLAGSPASVYSTFQDPSFHVSLAWCVGDQVEKLEEILEQLQELVDDREDGAFLLRLDCTEVCCRTGNKTFRFFLKQSETAPV